MKYLVISDIHGSLYYMKKALDVFNNDNCDKLIILGDLYYHGPRNNLPELYNPMEVSKLLNNIKDKIICVKGNCDAFVDEMISEFKFNELEKITINNKNIIFTHGHIYNIDNPIDDCDVLIYGHFHTGFINIKDNKIFINSGSISLPKNNTPNSYLIIEDNNIYLKDFNNQTIDKIKL